MNVRVHYQIGFGGAEEMLKIGTLEMRQRSISLSGDSLVLAHFHCNRKGRAGESPEEMS